METISHPRPGARKNSSRFSTRLIKNGNNSLQIFPTELRKTGNRGGRFLATIRDQKAKGICLRPLTARVLELCENFDVSVSTAYRHARAGTTPASQRCIGADGKSRPVATVASELRLAQSALARADQKAHGATPDEAEMLRGVIEQAQEICQRWEVLK